MSTSDSFIFVVIFPHKVNVAVTCGVKIICSERYRFHCVKHTSVEANQAIVESLCFIIIIEHHT